MPENANFSWIEPYQAIANTIYDHRADRDFIEETFKNNCPENWLIFPEEEIDPLSFMTLFNRRQSDKRRIAIIEDVLSSLGVDVSAPSDFTGIPVMNNMKSRFQGNSHADISATENDWNYFIAAIEYANNPTETNAQTFCEAFDSILKQDNSGIANITMVLFYIRPSFYLPLDNNTQSFLNEVWRLTLPAEQTGKTYLTYLDQARRVTPVPFYQLSAWAYEGWYYPAEIYNPKLTSENWSSILNDPALVSQNTLIALKCFADANGELTPTEMANKYGRTKNFYTNAGSSLGKTAHEKFSTPLIEHQHESDEPYWPVAFLRKYASKHQDGSFCWKLRPEIGEALSNMDLDDLPLYEETPQSNNPDEQTHPISETHRRETNIPLNTILYGPPGTGKTYQTIAYSVAICESRPVEEMLEEMSTPAGFANVSNRYKKLREEGRIEFVTFHQSYGYEEFVEGLRPEFNEEERLLTYPVQDGIFKQFCHKADTKFASRAKASGSIPFYDENPQPIIWKVGLSINDVPDLEEQCHRDNCIRLGWKEIRPSEVEADETLSYPNKSALKSFDQDMQPGDFVLTPKDKNGKMHIAVITGDLVWRDDLTNAKRWRDVQWIGTVDYQKFLTLNQGKKLTMQSVYQLSRFTALELLEAAGIEDPIAVESGNTTLPYVFIIDEINRGNISKILGELITLLEPTKRIGMPEKQLVKLPFSGQTFGIPSNVYIVGTMNTADRSIALMDTALRRRFSFKEIMPMSSLLENKVIEGVNLANLLDTMNKRIEVLYDREHTIGHAYFMNPTLDKDGISALALIFDEEIIPLLQDYFFDDYERIRSVLGAAANDFIEKVEINDIFWQEDESAPTDSYVFRVKHAPLDPASYQRIYTQ